MFDLSKSLLGPKYTSKGMTRSSSDTKSYCEFRDTETAASHDLQGLGGFRPGPTPRSDPMVWYGKSGEYLDMPDVHALYRDSHQRRTLSCRLQGSETLKLADLCSAKNFNAYPEGSHVCAGPASKFLRLGDSLFCIVHSSVIFEHGR